VKASFSPAAARLLKRGKALKVKVKIALQDTGTGETLAASRTTTLRARR
jgi:hypothetical protein